MLKKYVYVIFWVYAGLCQAGKLCENYNRQGHQQDFSALYLYSPTLPSHEFKAILQSKEEEFSATYPHLMEYTPNCVPYHMLDSDKALPECILLPVQGNPHVTYEDFLSEHELKHFTLISNQNAMFDRCFCVLDYNETNQLRFECKH